MPRKKPSLRKMPRCCRRKHEGGEAFRYLRRNFVFDVDRAQELVRDGREPVELSEESVRLSLEGTHINRRHLRHVDPSRPGIIAHVQAKTVDGEVFKGHVLIDGNHRAMRCAQLHRRFFAYLLTEEESQAVLSASPRNAFVRRPQVRGGRRRALRNVTPS